MEIDEEDNDDTIVDPGFVVAMDLHVDSDSTDIVVTPRANMSYNQSQSIFNRLPIHIRNISACSIDRFKSQLDRYLRTIPDLPSQPGYNNSLDGGDGIQRWTLRDGLAAELM